MTSLSTENMTLLLNITRTSNDCKDTSNVKTVLITLYVLTFMIGFIGNTCVIYYFGFKKKNKLKFDYYLIHLAIADLMASVLTSIHYVYVLLLPKWTLGIGMCKIVSSVGPLTVNVSAWIVMSIAVERCRGISTPYKERLRKSWIHALMTIIWILSMLMLIPYMSAMQIYKGVCTPFWTNQKLEFTYSVMLLMFQSVVPICTMVGSFLRIRKAVSHRSGSVTLHFDLLAKDFEPNLSIQKRLIKKKPLSVLQKKQDKKLFKMLMISCVVFIVCTLPYNVFYSAILYAVHLKRYYLSESRKIMIQNANIWLSSLVVINSCINFFIYTGLDKNFMKFCKSIIRCKMNQEIAKNNGKAQCFTRCQTNNTTMQMILPRIHSPSDLKEETLRQNNTTATIQIHKEGLGIVTEEILTLKTMGEISQYNRGKIPHSQHFFKIKERRKIKKRYKNFPTYQSHFYWSNGIRKHKIKYKRTKIVLANIITSLMKEENNMRSLTHLKLYIQRKLVTNSLPLFLTP